MSTIDEIRRIRLEKIAKLKELGINAYPAHSQKDADNADVVEKFEEYQGKQLNLCGRIMSFRKQGAITFAHIFDETGKIQLFIRKQELLPTSAENQNIGYDDIRLIDIGDFVQAYGKVDKSTTGEISVMVESIKLLAKSLRPLPEKWSGMTDQELIFRRRYLDLVMNPERKDLFVRKSKFWQLNRQFMIDNGFIEVETPIMELVTGGADAKPFITHHNALDQDFYLRISSELYQKRLIGGGFEKIYTLGANFRNEGIDDEHLQEYYQIEWYWAYADYRQNMTLVESMFKYIANNLYHKSVFTRGEHTFDLNIEWPRVSYGDLIQKRFSVDIMSDSEEKILEILHKQKIDTTGLTNRARIVDNLWKIVRKEIAGPLFIIDEPKFSSPLAKSREDKPELTERFHVIIAGSELGNGYSELNDPVDQFERFTEQQKNRESGDEESQMMDVDYVEMLEWGMPPTSGYAHSERLFWFLENITAREGTLFPQMKYEVSDETRRIYNLPKQSSSLKEDKHITGNNNSVYEISPELLKKYPTIKTGVAIIEGVTVTKENAELEKQKLEIENKLNGLTQEEISKISPIAAYRNFFHEFGVDPTSHIPSPDALVRRVAEGKHLYKINTLVDSYNVACLETHVGMSAMNLDNISLPMTLKFAADGEQITLLGGDEVKKTKAGEVVYADQQGIITLDLNYRDCDRSKITEKTKNVLLTVDSCPGISDAEISHALDREIELIQKYCGGKLVLKQIGSSVSKPHDTKAGLQNDQIVIGEIIEFADHPNADKLHVLKVNVGQEVLQIVCGAQNIKLGDIVPVSLVGSCVFDLDHNSQEISVAKLRGVESHGMLCSTRELGLGDDHSGIYLLDEKLRENIGEPVNKFIKL